MDKKKNIANEIVTIFSIFQTAIICSLAWLLGFSVYNKYVIYAFSNKHIGWATAREILGDWVDWSYNKVYIGNGLVEMEITEEKYQMIRQSVIDQLLEDSVLSALWFFPRAFGVLLLLHYIIKAVKWTKKYAD